MKHIKLFENFNEENITENFELKYEKWKFGGYSEGSDGWNLYSNNTLVCGISNYNKDKFNLLIKHIESKKKGMATKLIFMLLDNGVVIETGKPDYNSISTTAYYTFKKIVDLINKNSDKYSVMILGKANNKGKENYEPYIESSTKKDNFHYRFSKRFL